METAWAQLRKRETMSCPPFPTGKPDPTWSQLGVNASEGLWITTVISIYLHVVVIQTRRALRTFSSSLLRTLRRLTWSSLLLPVPCSSLLLPVSCSCSAYSFSQKSALSTFTLCIYMCAWVRMHACVQACVHICMCVHVHMCMLAYVLVFYIYMCM